MTTTQTAESAYIAQYARALAAIRAIENKIHNLPAPEGEIEITWGHVADMGRIVDGLEEVAEY